MTQQPSSSSQRRSLRYLIPIILPIILIGGLFAVRTWTPPNSGSLTAVANAALEERWGVRFTQLHVIGDGGLLDLRYQVIDPAKALGMLDDLQRMPKLIDEDSGVQIALNSATHKHNLDAGRTYYILYGNSRGSIKPGDAVTIVMSEQKLEHVIAQ